jgi:hypothetical protein
VCVRVCECDERVVAWVVCVPTVPVTMSDCSMCLALSVAAQRTASSAWGSLCSLTGAP